MGTMSPGYFLPNARRKGTIALISSADSFSLKGGILLFGTPLVMASTISSSVVCFCHLSLVKFGALYCLPFLVWLLPSTPWQKTQRFSHTSCGVDGPVTGAGEGVWAR